MSKPVGLFDSLFSGFTAGSNHDHFVTFFLSKNFENLNLLFIAQRPEFAVRAECEIAGKSVWLVFAG